jgi:hypothetical protein
MNYSDLYVGAVIAWGPKTISIVGSSFGKDQYNLTEFSEDKKGDFWIDHTAIDEGDWNRNSQRQNAQFLTSPIVVQTSQHMRHSIIDQLFDKWIIRDRR